MENLEIFFSLIFVKHGKIGNAMNKLAAELV